MDESHLRFKLRVHLWMGVNTTHRTVASHWDSVRLSMRGRLYLIVVGMITPQFVLSLSWHYISDGVTVKILTAGLQFQRA